ncbi:alpha/beta hydrolase [Puniceibacterium sediminis]|nr:alpha/beta hydrolase-fold protein [Puniceibacterium sediminis]
MPTPSEARLAMAQPDLWQGPQPAHVLSQRVLPRGDLMTLRLFIARPLQPDGSVIYMLDGGALPPMLLPDLLARHPGLAVVAVGYDTERAFSPAERYFDYAPAATPDEARNLRFATGGAEAFSTLLTGELRSIAEDGLDIDPARRSVWGHSLGGLFALTQMLTAPQEFAGYVAASPSIWMCEQTMTRLAHAALALDGCRLLCTMGDNERRSNAPPLDRPTPPPATLRLLDVLDQRGDLTAQRHVFPGAKHGPALALSLPLALDYARQT